MCRKSVQQADHLLMASQGSDENWFLGCSCGWDNHKSAAIAVRWHLLLILRGIGVRT